MSPLRWRRPQAGPAKHANRSTWTICALHNIQLLHICFGPYRARRRVDRRAGRRRWSAAFQADSRPLNARHPFPRDRSGRHRHRAVCGALVRACLLCRHPDRLVVCAPARLERTALGRQAGADHARGYRRFPALARGRHRAAAAASATRSSISRPFPRRPARLLPPLGRRHVVPRRACRRRSSPWRSSRSRRKIPMLSLFDVAAASVTFGLFFGRLANFINGELWGRVTDAALGRGVSERRSAAAASEPALRGGARRRRCSSSCSASSRIASAACAVPG